MTSHSLMNLTKFNSSKGINRLDVVLKGTRSSSLTPCSSCKKGKRTVGRRILEIIPHFSATQVEILEDTIKHFQGVGGKFNSISEASGTRLLKSLFTPYGLKSIWGKVDQFIPRLIRCKTCIKVFFERLIVVSKFNPFNDQIFIP